MKFAFPSGQLTDETDRSPTLQYLEAIKFWINNWKELNTYYTCNIKSEGEKAQELVQETELLDRYWVPLRGMTAITFILVPFFFISDIFFHHFKTDLKLASQVKVIEKINMYCNKTIFVMKDIVPEDLEDTTYRWTYYNSFFFALTTLSTIGQFTYVILFLKLNFWGFSFTDILIKGKSKVLSSQKAKRYETGKEKLCLSSYEISFLRKFKNFAKHLTTHTTGSHFRVWQPSSLHESGKNLCYHLCLVWYPIEWNRPD